MTAATEARVGRVQRLIGEPVLPFGLIAVLFFAVDAWRGASGEPVDDGEPAAPAVDRRIIITERLVAALEEDFRWLEGRAPNAEESEALVRDWLSQEILFREALAQNMHLTDPGVRERLVNTVRMLWAGNSAEPDERVLLDYYLDNVERYSTERKVSFQHVFFARRPPAPASVLAALRAGEPVGGDDYWLGPVIERYDESVLRSLFGGANFERLLAEPGRWIGPLDTPRGTHFVKVSEVLAPTPLRYADIRDQVLADWTAEARNARLAALVDSLRGNYEIRDARADG